MKILYGAAWGERRRGNSLEKKDVKRILYQVGQFSGDSVYCSD